MKKIIALLGFTVCFATAANAQLKYENSTLLLNTEGYTIFRPTADSYFRGREFAFAGVYGRIFSIRIESNGGAPVNIGSDGGYLKITDPNSNAYQDLCLANLYSYSDASGMTDVQPLQNMTDVVMQLTPVTYLSTHQNNTANGLSFPANSGNRKIGFVAQDMMPIVPPAVAQTTNGYLIDYNALIPVLVSAIKEQNARIAALESEIATLKGK